MARASPWPWIGFAALVVFAAWGFAWATSGAQRQPSIVSAPGDGSDHLLVTALAKLEPLAWTQTPTPTSTATGTPVPTSTQQVVWVPDPCSTPEPGALCRVPDRMPNTPTPYPSCYGMVEPGTWCRWEIADDAPGAQQETR